MAIRNMLVHVEDGATGEARVDTAATLARALGAQLTGLYVSAPAVPKMAATRTGIPAGTQPEAYEMERQIKSRQAESRAVARGCEQRFRQVVRDAEIEADWYWTIDEPLSALAGHALYADLVVTGQTDGVRTESAGEDLSGRLVSRIASPLLVLPSEAPARVLGDRILVAWSPELRAQRAVHAALPLLKRANRVEVVTINGRASGPTDRPPTEREIRKYFARHAVPVDFRPLAGNGLKVGETLLAHAAYTGADLIVMGAYHHSRLREALLGGVTHHVLRHATLPVLFAH